MKICLVAPRIGKVNGAFLGGSVNNVVNLSKELAKKHEIHLVTTPPTPRSKVEGIDWCHVHELTVRGSQDSLRYGFEFLIKAISMTKKLCKKERFDIINSHSGTPKLGLISGIAGKICKVPSIHTLYTPITLLSGIDKREHAMFSNYRLFSSPFFLKLYLSQIDKVIAISNNVKKSLAFIPDDKIYVIPPCIDLHRFNQENSKEEARKKLGLYDEPTLLFLGEREAKGIGLFIESLKVCKKKIPDIKAIIIAGLEKDEVLKKIKSNGLGNNVIVLGVVNMPQVIKACDIFVAPFLSTFDVLDIPISILEAMAEGKPVIATKVGGIPEIKSITLIEPNVDQLSDTIISHLSNHSEFDYGESIKFFSSERVGRMTENIYNEVAHE